MRAGPFISGAGHAALIALAVWGLPWLSPRDSEAVRVTEVSFVTEADLAAAQAAAEAARAADAPPEQPAAEAPPPAPEVARGPGTGVTLPEPAPETPAEELPSLAPEFNPDAPLAAPLPEFSTVVPRVVTLAPPTAVTLPRPRPVERITPDRVPAPQEPARPAEETVVAAAPTPEPEPEITEPETTPRAPEESAPEPVAEPSPPAELALVTSGRPMPRQVDPRPAPTPAPPVEQPSPQAAIQSAVAAAAAAGATAPTQPTVTPPTPPSATSLPQGPPITLAERDGLKFAIQRCWNVPAGLRDADELKITVAAELDSDGVLLAGTVRLIDPATIIDGRFDAAYRAARSALIRCSPYSDLPRDKFAQWRNIEVVFNPEGMVSW